MTNLHSNVIESLKNQLNNLKKLDGKYYKKNTHLEYNFLRKLVENWRSQNLNLESIFSNTGLESTISKLFIYAHDEFLFRTHEIEICPVIDDISSFVLSGTHNSASFGRKIYENGCIEIILKDILTHSLFSNSKKNDVKNLKILPYKRKEMIMFYYFGILHNVLRLNEDLRVSLRNLGAIETIMNILRKLSPNRESGRGAFHEAFCYIILVYLVDEDELNLVEICKEALSFIKVMLKDGLNNSTNHQSQFGFHVDEIVHALNQLAKCDRNKALMIDLIPTFYDIIDKPINNLEIVNTLECLHTLSFNKDCREGILRNTNPLHKLTLKDDNEIKKLSKNLLWELNNKSSEKKLSIPSSDQHIMISYEWDDQDVVLKIANFLKSKGYKIWLDLDKMTGSILESMGDAVDNSSIVLICYSMKYSKSLNCRSEAEYARHCNKPIIPLRMESQFKPKGWLGLLLGPKLYIDFANPNIFSISYENLIKEINNHDIDSNIQEFNNLTINYDKKTKLADWTKEDVQRFIKEDEILKSYISKFKLNSGKDFMEYKILCESNLPVFLEVIHGMGIPKYCGIRLSAKLRELN